MIKISREDIEYALAACGHLYYEDGKRYYEENELLECLDDLFFSNPNVDFIQSQIEKGLENE